MAQRIFRFLKRTEHPFLFSVGEGIRIVSGEKMLKITAHIIALTHRLLYVHHSLSEMTSSFLRLKSLCVIPSPASCAYQAAAHCRSHEIPTFFEYMYGYEKVIIQRINEFLSYLQDVFIDLVKVIFRIYQLTMTLVWTEEEATESESDIAIHMKESLKLLFDQKRSYNDLLNTIEPSLTSVFEAIGLKHPIHFFLHCSRKGLEFIEKLYQRTPFENEIGTQTTMGSSFILSQLIGKKL